MTVNVLGMQVADGDLVHADRHGALVVPADVFPVLDLALDRLAANEALVLEPLRAGDAGLEEFEAAWSAFEAART
ncbi:MAG TPA: hypothetical protein VIL84_01140 [Devosiaceae bacterium]